MIWLFPTSLLSSSLWPLGFLSISSSTVVVMASSCSISWVSCSLVCPEALSCSTMPTKISTLLLIPEKGLGLESRGGYRCFSPLYEVWGSPQKCVCVSGGGGGDSDPRDPPPPPGSAPGSSTIKCLLCTPVTPIDFSRPVALLVVTIETVRQTNQSTMTTGSPLISPIDHANKASAGAPIGYI